MMLNDMEVLMQAKENSIGRAKKDKLVIKTKQISKKVIAISIALLLSVSLCACSLTKNENTQNVHHHYVDMYVHEHSAELENILEENGLRYDYADNSIEQYKSILQELNEKDMIIYYDNLGRLETEKICIAFGYEGMNHFLIENGYVDEQGNPSIQVLRQVSDVNMSNEVSEKIK